MKKPHNTFRSLIIFILLNSVVINAYSISITARRLYLDPKSSTTSIRVLNLDAQVQRCDVTIKDIVITNQGNVALAASGEVTVNSAKPLVRLAPRRFTLNMNENQMVKLLYRRKPGVKSGEYQGVLAIKCKEKSESSDAKVTIAASLVHNVPVIVRTGILPIKAEFVSTQIIGDTLHVELKIKGERSLTGNLALINSDSDEIVAERKDVSIYAQQPVKKLIFALGEYRNTPLSLTFTENSKFGGELIIEQKVK
jgi:hypothetical protein